MNNAGVMAVPKPQVTEDGFELQFGTNFLGPFTGLLMLVLQRSASPRVTTVSSGAANMGTRKINFDDLQWETSYGPWKAYCQSKLADLMFTLELGRRCAADADRLLYRPLTGTTEAISVGNASRDNALRRCKNLIIQ